MININIKGQGDFGSWRGVTVCLQVYAEHCGRTLRAGGGLPLWPGGDAPGGPQQQAALPRGLCAVRLGALEPLLTGEIKHWLIHCVPLQAGRNSSNALDCPHRQITVRIIHSQNMQQKISNIKKISKTIRRISQLKLIQDWNFLLNVG